MSSSCFAESRNLNLSSPDWGCICVTDVLGSTLLFPISFALPMTATGWWETLGLYRPANGFVGLYAGEVDDETVVTCEADAPG